MIASYALKLTLLQHAQERDLRLHREIADFIKEKCPAVSGFEPPHASLQGTREGALLVSEKLRGNQRLRDGRTVHADERSRCAVRSTMERTSNQFFTRSGFAEDESGRIRWRYFCHLLQHLPHGFTRTDNFLKHRGAVDLFTQSKVLVLEALLSQLAILYVGSRRIPANNPALFVFQRIVLTQVPTILAVFSECAQLVFERGAM